MIINLDRYSSTKRATNGQMFINCAHFCYTLEDVVRPEGVKIYGETAIPEGIYEVCMAPFRGDVARIYPHILNVPMFQGIFIHGGNTADDTLGCPLVGYKEAKDWVGECKPALEELCSRIQKALDGGDTVKIQIKNG